MENLIRHCRKREGLTQAQLAERVGVDHSTLSKWERGNSVPDEFKKALAQFFEMPVHQLFVFDSVQKVG